MAEITDSFGRITDFIRDTVVAKMGEFFTFEQGQKEWFNEMPVIEKYEVTEEQEKFSSTIHIQRYFIDLFEKLPLIAVTSVGAAKFDLNLSQPFILAGRSKKIVSFSTENYTLTDESILNLSVGGVLYSVEFLSDMFVDISDVSILELAGVFDTVLPFIRATDTDDKLTIQDRYGRDIIVINGSAASELGFSDGQEADETMHKFSAISESLNVDITVITSDRNQRIELMDLVSALFEFYLYEKYLGQWMTEAGYITFTGRASRKGESEIDLEGAPVSKLYIDGISVPVVGVMQVDRTEDIEDLNVSGEGTIP